MVSALGVFELGLRPFATAWREKPFNRPAEVRQYYEGVAVAHFGPEAQRLTGNDEVAGAPNILILGDSHVEALQVNDAETMGATLERLARAAGAPANARQYGWSSAAAPTYAIVAPKLISRWQPERVVVVMTPGDFGQAFYGPERLKIVTGDRPEIIEEPAPVLSGWQKQFGAPVISRSVLAYHLYRSLVMMKEAAQSQGNLSTEEGTEPALALAASASIQVLKGAYGARLLIVYDPFLYGLHTDTADDGTIEAAVLAACRQEAVECVTTREALTQDRLTHQRLSRGFSNRAPGTGHWNATGNSVVADVIWQRLRSELAGR
ncbi:MAG TPA: hypothetical protein VM009_04855 [Terriglobales bacterium]|nr:hypothetical protein [Terriglobales bacterium]